MDEIPASQYYNKYTGNLSVIITSILAEELVEFDDWDSNYWLDDSLLSKLSKTKDSFSIWGIVIKGKEGTTRQWTEPFYFEIKSDDEFKTYRNYTFLFGEKNSKEFPYEEFKYDRGLWDSNFYSNSSWNPSERDWNFIIAKNRNS